MGTMLAMLAAVMGQADAKADPVKDLVLKFLLSYGGIAGGVSFLVEGLKGMFKTWVTGRENILVIVLTFFLGSAAKWLIPGVYGTNTVQAWGLHELILIFVCVGAAAFHDKFLSVLMSFLQKPAATDQGSPPPPPPPPPTAPPSTGGNS